MAKYWEKFVEVDAMCVEEVLHKFHGHIGLPEWLQKAYEDGALSFSARTLSLEGYGRLEPRDWITCGYGTVLRVVPEIRFVGTYEPARDARLVALEVVATAAKRAAGMVADHERWTVLRAALADLEALP